MNDLTENLFGHAGVLRGGLALMLAGWAGYQLRALPARLWHWLRTFTTRVVHIRENHPDYDAWLALLTEHAIRRDGPRSLEMRARWDEDGRRITLPTLAAGADEFWARVQGTWCHVTVRREEGGAKTNLSLRFLMTVELLWCSRATLASIVDRVARRAAAADDRQPVDLYQRHQGTTTVKIPRRDPRTLCLPPAFFDSIHARLAEFCAAREEHERAGIPWRFGLLLSGPPGTGKTSLTHALASRLGLRIAVIMLADLQSDQELVDAFRSVGHQTIVLIEDVDCAFRQRGGGESDGAGGGAAGGSGGISFSGLLNCIDGVLAGHNGRILVMSTNHPERLDPALIRPGRIDLHIQMLPMTRQDASDYVDRIFPHVAARHDAVNEIMSTPNPTPAALINRLMREKWHKPAARSTTPVSPDTQLVDELASARR
jgi:hypothetical protein